MELAENWHTWVKGRNQRLRWFAQLDSVALFLTWVGPAVPVRASCCRSSKRESPGCHGVTDQCLSWQLAHREVKSTSVPDFAATSDMRGVDPLGHFIISFGHWDLSLRLMPKLSSCCERCNSPFENEIPGWIRQYIAKFNRNIDVNAIRASIE